MAMRPQDKTSATRIEAEARRTTALSLRRAGASYKQIGAQMGVSDSRAFQLVTDAMERNAKHFQEVAADVLELELMRLDAMMIGPYNRAVRTPAADEQNFVPDYDAVECVLKIMERRAKLLGLDKINANIGFDDAPMEFTISVGEKKLKPVVNENVTARATEPPPKWEPKPINGHNGGNGNGNGNGHGKPEGTNGHGTT